MKYTEAVVSKSTRNLLWFDFIVSFIIIFSTLSFPVLFSLCFGHMLFDCLPLQGSQLACIALLLDTT